MSQILKSSPSDHQWNDFLLRKRDPYAMAKYEILLEWIGEISGKAILIVGSGSGEFAAMLALRGAHVTAIDVSPDYVDLTKKTAIDFGVKLHTFVSRLEDFRSNQRFDIVAATDVIEHIEDDEKASKDLSSFLKETGQLLITVPAMPSLFGYHDEVLGHYRRYTASTLRTWASRRFRIEKMRHYGFCLIPVAWLISKTLRKPYPVAQVGGDGSKKSFIPTVVGGFLKAEKKIQPPLGTSLLMLAKPILYS